MANDAHFDVLDDFQRLQEVDTRNMLRLVDELPEQCETALGIGSSLKLITLEELPNAVVVEGMGECAVAADMIRAYLATQTQVPVIAIHQPSLPGCVKAGTVVVILDYTLKNPCTRSIIREAIERGAKVILGASARVPELEDHNDLTYLKIPPGQPERSAMGYLFVPTLVALHKLGLVADVPTDISRAILHMKNLRETYRFSTPTFQNPAKQIARQIAYKTTVIYGPSDFGEPVANRWRNQICGNAKAPACAGRLPDAAFVEVAGCHGLDSFAIVIMRDPTDSLSMQLVAASQDIIDHQAAIVVDLKGANPLERMWHGVYLGDYVSCYLALIYGVNPWFTEHADLFQKRMDQWGADEESQAE